MKTLHIHILPNLSLKNNDILLHNHTTIIVPEEISNDP